MKEIATVTERPNDNYSELADHYRELNIDIEKRLVTVLLSAAAGGIVLSSNVIVDPNAEPALRSLLTWTAAYFAVALLLLLAAITVLALRLSAKEEEFRAKANAQTYRNLVYDTHQAVKNGNANLDQESKSLLSNQSDKAADYESRAERSERFANKLVDWTNWFLILGLIALLLAVSIPIFSVLYYDYF